MDTATKPSQPPRATERVVEGLVTLVSLLDRVINEVKSVDSDFQNRILQAVHETEASLQCQAAQHLETELAATRVRFEGEFKKRLAEVSMEWEAERNRLNNELNRLTEASARWEAERTRLAAEIEHLARVQAATQTEAEKAIAAVKAAASSADKSMSTTTNIEALSEEMERVDNLIKKISTLIEDPATELSIVIRKNVERAELESYLKGIRFALNGTGRN